MARPKKQKALIFDWDTAPDETSGFTEIQFPEHPLYYLNFSEVRHERRVLWWIDITTPQDYEVGRYEKVIMDFACDIPAAQRAAETAFFRLLKAPKFAVVT
jgi:hypothetical protein